MGETKQNYQQASDNQNMNQNGDPIKEEKQQLQRIKTQKAEEKYQQNQQLYSQHQIHPQQMQYLHDPKMHQTLLSEAFIDCIPSLNRVDHNYSSGVSKNNVSSMAKPTIRLISKGDQFDCFSTEQLGTHIDCLHKALQLHNIYNINL